MNRLELTEWEAVALLNLALLEKSKWRRRIEYHDFERMAFRWAALCKKLSALPSNKEKDDG